MPDTRYVIQSIFAELLLLVGIINVNIWADIPLFHKLFKITPLSFLGPFPKMRSDHRLSSISPDGVRHRSYPITSSLSPNSRCNLALFETRFS